jgi:hypothetical protein
MPEFHRQEATLIVSLCRAIAAAARMLLSRPHDQPHLRWRTPRARSIDNPIPIWIPQHHELPSPGRSFESVATMELCWVSITWSSSKRPWSIVGNTLQTHTRGIQPRDNKALYLRTMTTQNHPLPQQEIRETILLDTLDPMVLRLQPLAD